jgi:CheY-like chemotaxis protein
MSTMIANRTELPPDGQLPVSPDTFGPSPDDPALPSDHGLRIDSDASRVLIVDDNPDILKLVSKMAAHLGYHPTTAEDGVDALYHLSRTHFDLVMTDYEMPFIDGYQLADQIKEKHFGTRVIIMTGHCERDVEDLLDGSGIVDGLLLKPFSLEAMKEKIELVCCPHYGQWTPTARG